MSGEQTNVPVKATEGFGSQSLERSAELSSIAIASAAKAEVEAAFIMAIRNPRNEDDARVRILRSCSNPIFAAKARYRKPVGKKEINGKWEQQFVIGPSIRFAEEMLRCWKNVITQATAIYDDPSKRIVKITVRDLEANLTYSKEVTLEKTVERTNGRDREVLGQRTNSYNQIVNIVRTTEDELTIKEAALTSKIIRNNGLRLIPQHIVEEAMNKVEEMIRDKVTKDPNSERKSILDGLSGRGVLPSEVEKYIGCPVAQFTADDLVQLRDILNSIEDGHSTWAEFIEGSRAESSGEMGEKSQPATKGAAILEKIGKAAEPSAGLAQPAAALNLTENKPNPTATVILVKTQAKGTKAAPKAPTPTETSTPIPEAAAAAPSGFVRDIPDSEWADILSYLDEDQMRSWVRKNVKEKGKYGPLLEVQNPIRAQFLLDVQEEAKRENVIMETFVASVPQ